MARNKSEFEIVVGKLISIIQKEWGKELGEPIAELLADVITEAHYLLQARTVEEYLGELWVKNHPGITDCREYDDGLHYQCAKECRGQPGGKDTVRFPWETTNR